MTASDSNPLLNAGRVFMWIPLLAYVGVLGLVLGITWLYEHLKLMNERRTCRAQRNR